MRRDVLRQDPLVPATLRARGSHRPRRAVAGLTALALTATGVAAAVLGAPAASAAEPPASYDFHSTGNPILADGSYYSADPAPLVVPGDGGDPDRLYVHTGHDQAGPTTNDFVMNEWGAFTTTDLDSGDWTHYPSLMRPETVFSWATPGRAYAGQVVEGVDGRYYWYVPVAERSTTASDAFGIGVAVSDTPVGPWTDAVGGPIISQRVPTPNTIHNIDPTILVDGAAPNQRVYVYWGSFGNLRMLELGQDMITPVGTTQTVTGLTGYFEAPWIFKRSGTYYMAYAGNDAGPTSACTPANYHACIAYATASSPRGPWTYRGTVLGPVSSTTSHPGIFELDGEWHIVYHTADAVGGNHFRRSIAIDTVTWDDTQNPPRMTKVVQTPVKGRDTTPRANVAQEAKVTVSNNPVPTQYWVKALNDELVRPNPLPPDMWGTWTGSNPAQQWVQYTWDSPVRVSGSQIDFWNDQPQGTGVGVAAPGSWKIQYWDGTGGGSWKDVASPSGYPTSTSGYQSTTFAPVTTTQVRAVLNASTNGSTYSAVAVEEWKVLAEQPTAVDVPGTTVEVGETAVPTTASLTFAGGSTLAVPVYWDTLSDDDVAAPGTVALRGTALGYAAGRVTTDVRVIDPADTGDDTTAPVVTLASSGSAGTAGWYRSAVRVRAASVDDGGGRSTIETRVDGGAWASTPDARSADVTVSGDGTHTVDARATDRAGNLSAVVSTPVTIDATVPTVTATLDAAARTAVATAADTTSGVGSVEYMVGTGAWQPYTGPVPAQGTAQTVVTFRATDKAGNASVVRSVTIPADVSGPLTGNVAPIAVASASYTASWNAVGSLNDGLVPASPSQAQLWGTWSGTRPASQWVQYDWSRPIRLTDASVKFWQDSPKGTGDGVAEPSSWVLQFWDASGAGAWVDVPSPSAYGTSTTAFSTVTFAPVTTSKVRATVKADSNGTTYSAVAIVELRVTADDPGVTPPAPDLDVELTATSRCVGPNAYVAVKATNGEDVSVSMEIGTAFGSKTGSVAAGKALSQTFNARSGSVGAGTATLEATGTVDGHEVTTTVEAPYTALTCGSAS